MTDEKIIKALRLCATLDSDNCKKCPCREICNENDGTLTKLTLDLINHQKAEIERLKAENKNQKLVIEEIEDIINPLPFETDFEKAIRTAKTEAIKEFAERLKKQFKILPSFKKKHDDCLRYC